MRRFAATVLSLCMLIGQTAYAEEIQKFLTDGNIHLELEGADSGEEVAVIITPESRDWLNESAWTAGELSDDILSDTDNYNYFDTVVADDEGKYSVDIVLDTMGIYNVIAGPKKYQIKYTDIIANQTAISAVTGAASGADVYSLLNNDANVQALCLDDDIFTNIKADTDAVDGKLPLERVAELVYDELAANPYVSTGDAETDSSAINNVIYRACLTVMLNNDCAALVGNISDYLDIIDLNSLGLSEYYNENCSAYITTLLKSKEIISISELKSRMMETILLANIKYNDGTAAVKGMLQVFAEQIGITDTSKITDASVGTLVGNTYNNAGEVAAVINKYVPVVKKPSGGGSSSVSRGPSSSIGSSLITPQTNIGADIKNREIFTDTASVPWAQEAINTLARSGIVSGRTATEFMPNEEIKREEFVQLLVTALSLNVIGNDMDFEDVTKDDWYYRSVRSAFNAEIVRGISENLFGAGMNITRQDMAVMAARAAYIAGVDLSSINERKEFIDESMISDYAKESVAQLQMAGVMSGDETGAFNPYDSATRAQAAQIIYMIYKKIM